MKKKVFKSFKRGVLIMVISIVMAGIVVPSGIEAAGGDSFCGLRSGSVFSCINEDAQYNPKTRTFTFFGMAYKVVSCSGQNVQLNRYGMVYDCDVTRYTGNSFIVSFGYTYVSFLS